MMITCRLLGDRYRFAAAGCEMRWACVVAASPVTRRYPSEHEARRFAAAVQVKDRGERGGRTLLLGLPPLRSIARFDGRGGARNPLVQM
jgi:hypothetical protein